MPKRNHTIAVQQVKGEPMRYWVESWEKPEFYHLVDLLAHEGNGACDCRDYLTRCEPNYRDNGGHVVEYGYPGAPDPKRTRCKHLHVAVRKWANDSLAYISKNIEKGAKAV